MSAIGPVDHFDVSPEKAYFRQLESFVIALCGAPHQLSPDDWKVSRTWHQAEIPLDVVEKAMREVVERRQEADEEVPRRLRFYQRAVTSAWKEISQLTVTGDRQAAPSFDIEGRVTRLRHAVERLDEVWVEAIARDLGALVDGENPAENLDPETLERQLIEIDASLLEAAEAHLDEPTRRDIESGIEAVLRPVVARLPAHEAAQARERLWRERIRRALTLPVLSLFSLDAVDEAGSDAGSD